MKNNNKNRFKAHFVAIVALLSLLSTEIKCESRFSGKSLENAVLQFVMKNVSPDADIVVHKKVLDQVFDDDGIKAHCTASPETLRGMCSVGIEFYLNNNLIRKIDVPVRVKIYQDVPVAIRPIKVGTLISLQDFTLQKMDVTHYTKESLITQDALIGSMACRIIPKGWIITSEYLKPPNIVKRGEKVTISVVQGAVRIRASGIAMQDASLGESLKVQREGSILQGTVAKDGTIIIGSD